MGAESGAQRLSPRRAESFRVLGYGLSCWFVPFAVAMALYPLRVTHRPLFESMLSLVLAAPVVGVMTRCSAPARDVIGGAGTTLRFADRCGLRVGSARLGPVGHRANTAKGATARSLLTTSTVPRLVLLVVLTFALPMQAVAQDRVRLDLAEAMRRAQTHAPLLETSMAAVRASHEVQRAADAVLPLPPRVELAAGPRVKSEFTSASAEASAGLWFDVPVGGYGEARRAFATASIHEAQQRQSLALHDVRTAAGLAWVEARFARELVRIRAESLGRAEHIETLTHAIVDSGKTSPSAQSLATLARGRARARLLDAEGTQFMADSRLRWWIGVPADAELVLEGDLATAYRPMTPQQITRLLASIRSEQPDVLAAAASADRAQRAAGVTQAQGLPVLSLGPGVTREGTGDWIFLARFQIPLPTVNPAALELAQARSDAAVSQARVRELAASIELECRLALEEREHTRKLLASLDEAVISPARDALQQAELRYVSGAIDLVVVLQTERDLLEAQESWAAAAADVRRSDIRLMRLLPAKHWPLGSRP